jgi:rubrerythrin
MKVTIDIKEEHLDTFLKWIRKNNFKFEFEDGSSPVLSQLEEVMRRKLDAEKNPEHLIPWDAAKDEINHSL